MACYPDTFDLSDDYISKEDIQTQIQVLHQTVAESEAFSDDTQHEMSLWGAGYKSALQHIYTNLIGDPDDPQPNN